MSIAWACITIRKIECDFLYLPMPQIPVISDSPYMFMHDGVERYVAAER